MLADDVLSYAEGRKISHRFVENHIKLCGHCVFRYFQTKVYTESEF